MSSLENTEPEDLAGEPIRYTVRLTEYATRDLEEIVYRVNDTTQSEKTALEWYQGLYAAIRGLSEHPKRYAVQEAESRKIGQEVRREIYRHAQGSRSATAYHLLYVVHVDTNDGPLVTVVHIRHASRKPLTRAEAKDIRAGQV